MNHTSQAVNDLKIAAEKLVNHPDAYYDLALALVATQAKEPALTALDRALKLNPRYTEAQNLTLKLRR